jgi:hypothetical protein
MHHKSAQPEAGYVDDSGEGSGGRMVQVMQLTFVFYGICGNLRSSPLILDCCRFD